MTTYAIGLEFSGANYRGFQKQNHDDCTVQARLEHALSTIANAPVDVVAAGRTDAGVHASNMIAHFVSNSDRSMHQWLRGTNSLLPNDIALRWICPVADDFHARFLAKKRRYHYVFINQVHKIALNTSHITHHYAPLDIARMQQACLDIMGEHDFSSFRAAACQSNKPVRTVTRANLVSCGKLWVLDIEADGFLHHMVRNLMGALFAIGEHKIAANSIQTLLEVKNRTLAPATAKPDGLYFVGASYNLQHLQTNFQNYAPPCWLCLPN